MNRVTIGSFESKTRGTIEVHSGYDDATIEAIYEHATDPGIVKTLGPKDLKRFSPEKFPAWAEKGGGRFLYTAWSKDQHDEDTLAGVFWVGGEPFPSSHFPDSDVEPAYTAAWRTGYSTPEGNTYEGEGIGKRIALAGIADVVKRTKNGGPTYMNGEMQVALPSLEKSGLWIDTGIKNKSGQDLYHHLGNTDRSQDPIGFRDIGIYTPPFREGMNPLEAEPRIGMVADMRTIQHLVAAASKLIKLI
jgi:hypothetical protein